MELFFDPDGTVQALDSLLTLCANSIEVKSILVLVCDENNFQAEPEQINAILHRQTLPVFGGIFPQIIHGSNRYSKGSLVIGLHHACDAYLLPNLSDPSVDFDEYIDEIVPSIGEARTMFVFFDGFSARLDSLTDSLFTLFGMEVNYIGGGAGSVSGDVLDLSTKPCLFTNQGLVADAALLVLSSCRSGIGVSHGWKKIDGPIKVTEVSGNSIVSLNWEPAFQVYKEIVEKHAGGRLHKESFFSIAQSYPFGLSRLSSEYVVRDPFAVDGDSLVFGTSFQAPSFVDILTGDVESMPEAIEVAITDARESYPGEVRDNPTLLFNCISRVMYLGSNIDREIEKVKSSLGMGQICGALTIGEIANSGKEYLEYFNKTSVVGILEK